MSKKTILALGDYERETNFRIFCEYAAKEKKIDLKTVEYSSLLEKKLPKINSDFAIMLFFPYNYWDENIEVYDTDDKIYGDQTFGKKFNEFWDKVEPILNSEYNGKLMFVNHAKNVKIDRDKKLAKQILKKNSIPTPMSYEVQDAGELLEISEQKNLYLKPRFGAMGKGITYLTKDKWVSNFDYKNGKIISKKSDYGWKFKEINEKDFLEKLLQRDILIEEEIKSPLIDGKKFDLRIYVIYGKIPYMYARTTQSGIVNNWCQGGKIESKEFLKKMPEESLEKAKKYAIKSVKSFGLNYAGMDVIFSEDYQPYVLEGQAFPSRETGFNLMKYLVEQIERKAFK